MEFYTLDMVPSDEHLESNDYVFVTNIVILSPVKLYEVDIWRENPVQEWSMENHALYRGSDSLNDRLVSRSSAQFITKNLMTVIRKFAGDQVTSFPIKLIHKTTSQPLNGYHVLFVNRVINCVNLKKTPHRKIKNGIELTDPNAPIVLNEKFIPEDVKIFRLHDLPMIVVLRSDLLERLKKFSGISVEKLH